MSSFDYFTHSNIQLRWAYNVVKRHIHPHQGKSSKSSRERWGFKKQMIILEESMKLRWNFDEAWERFNQNTFVQGVWILLKNTVIIYCVACEKLIVAKSEHTCMKIKPWFLQVPCTTESCRISIFFFFKSCDKVELLLMMKVVKQVLHVCSVISTAKGAQNMT